MTKPLKHVLCTKSDLEQLRILAGDTSHPRLAIKARIVLMCADGMKIKDIAEELGERPNTVILWRNRFIESGMKGLANKPRGIGQIKYGDEFLKRLRSKLDDPPPGGMKRWTGKALAEEFGVPLDAVWKYLRLAGIRLRDIHSNENSSDTDEIELPIVLRMTTLRRKDMNKKNTKEKADIELVARIKNPDGTYIEKVVTLEDAVPEIKNFDFSTKEGFLRDLNTYEKAMIKARDQVMKDITDEYLESGVKKNSEKGKIHEVDTELCRTRCKVYGSLASSLKPKEIIRALAIEELIFSTVTEESYRKGTSLLNRVLHRSDEESFKERTLKDHVCAVGREYKSDLNTKADTILEEYGFSTDGLTPPEDLTGIIPGPDLFDHTDPTQYFMDTIQSFNEGKMEEAQIKNMIRVSETETDPDECTYIFLDDVGVGHQKDTRKDGGRKTGKRVENTVIRVQSSKGSYSITDVGMDNALRLLLAFLIFTGEIMTKNLCFFSDGAANIRKGLERYFAFTNYTLHLDWYHLEKHLDETLSMALWKQARDILQPVLFSMLWAGNVEEAIEYLESLKPFHNVVKNANRLQEAIDYLGKKKPYVDCYALRKECGYINSSNPAEKENDILVAMRQKHNGMSWSYAGSSSLAVIESARRNDELMQWLANGKQSFSFHAQA